MEEKKDTRGSSVESRAAHKLALQSQQIEKVFSRHQLPVQVIGGSMRADMTSFRFGDQVTVGLQRLRELAQDIVRIMGVSEIQLDRPEGSHQISLTNQEDVPVALLDMLEIVTDLPVATAVLGDSEDGRPVLLDLSSPDLPHVLIAGDKGAGKTSLLRTMAVSLALTNRQSEVQLVVIDAAERDSGSRHSGLQPLSFLPHLLMPVTSKTEEAHDVLAFLMTEMAYRQEQHISVPAVVVLIDGFARLIAQGGHSLSELIFRLLQQGPAVGFHLALSIEDPDTDVLQEHVKASLPVRLIGRLANPRAANLAAGVSGSQASYLRGEGEFAAILGGDSMSYFQAAYVDDYDMQFSLDLLQNSRPQTLLAYPIDASACAAEDDLGGSSDVGQARRFSYDGESITWQRGKESEFDGTSLKTVFDEPTLDEES